MDFLLSSISMPPEVYNIKLVVAYDGSDFFGWQKTNCGPSIEGILKKTLEQILQEKIQLQAASRTDAGVHAEEQIVNFFIHKKLVLVKFMKSVNALLPSSIRVMDAQEMDLSFHPTLDAKLKEYDYQIYHGKILPPCERQRCWHIYQPLKLEKIELAIPYFLKQKDFSAFCNKSQSEKMDKQSDLLNITLSVKAEEKFNIVVLGRRFLYKMVRNIVGTLVAVGKGEILVEMVPEIFALRDRTKAAMTAPAHGLTLKKIIYDWKK